ncbi:MAG: family 10 glycosylhydrolase [Clostridia bacterium]|nr:family 10 glycosylhydrolase [Clostridia bacterium]
MKKILFCMFAALCLLAVPAAAEGAELRGVWVSTVYQLDYPSAPGLSAAQLELEADRIVENALHWGMNAVFLQVRPAADALYASKTEPWSAYLTGTQGRPADGGFDPLAYFIRICHENGLQLHAWINPYRITRRAAESREEAFSLLCETHPARNMADCVVFHEDGCLYYDPGRPEVQDMLLGVAEELLTEYDLDGLHLDDYFYPGSSFDDAATRARFGQDGQDPGDFRRAAVDGLVSALHALTHRLRPGVAFGVSPAGIWATRRGSPLGAATTGGQSYYDHFADSRRWVRENLVDYIAPQLYWEVGAPSGDFDVLLNWWETTARDTDAALYIGLAAYRSAEAEAGSPWYGTEELSRQLERIEASDVACGALFFRYGSLTGELGDALSQRFSRPRPAEAAPLLRPKAIDVSSPGGSAALESGEAVSIACAAPRGSRVSAFWGSSTYGTLRPDLRGGYSGALTVQTAGTQSSAAPLLLCAEKQNALFIKLIPALTAAVRTNTARNITQIHFSDKDAQHLFIFDLTGPCPAALRHSGDVLTLRIKNCKSIELPSDPFFSHLSWTEEDGDAIFRLVLPDDGTARRARLLWTENTVTVAVTAGVTERWTDG